MSEGGKKKKSQKPANKGQQSNQSKRPSVSALLDTGVVSQTKAKFEPRVDETDQIEVEIKADDVVVASTELVQQTEEAVFLSSAAIRAAKETRSTILRSIIPVAISFSS